MILNIIQQEDYDDEYLLTLTDQTELINDCISFYRDYYDNPFTDALDDDNIEWHPNLIKYIKQLEYKDEHINLHYDYYIDFVVDVLMYYGEYFKLEHKWIEA